MPSTSILKLSLFVADDPTDTPTATIARSPTASRSRRSFADGAVGLGIVAALSGSGGGVRGRTSALTRSEPIPIAPVRTLAAPRSPDEGELSESYTCVISHVGENSMRKRVYFGDGSEVVTVHVQRDREVLFKTPSPIPPPKPVIPFATMDLTSHCHLCMKKLEGIDIYMYRGYKAFCSAECRCQCILFDAHRENCGSEVLNSLECCVSLFRPFALCSWCCSSLIM